MSLFRFIFLFFALNALAACQSANNVPVSENSTAVETVSIPETPAQDKITKLSTATMEQEKPTPEIIVPPRIFPEASVLRGATPDQLTALIGAPDFLRKDKPAEFWQYRSSICRLDLILYERKTSANLTVDYFSVKTLNTINTANPVSPKNCLTSIIKQFETRTATN